jgi:hypothetical protein
MPAPTCADFFGIVSGALLLFNLLLYYFAYHTPWVKNPTAANHRSDDTYGGESFSL